MQHSGGAAAGLYSNILHDKTQEDNDRRGYGARDKVGCRCRAKRSDTATERQTLDTPALTPLA